MLTLHSVESKVTSNLPCHSGNITSYWSHNCRWLTLLLQNFAVPAGSLHILESVHALGTLILCICNKYTVTLSEPDDFVGLLQEISLNLTTKRHQVLVVSLWSPQKIDGGVATKQPNCWIHYHRRCMVQPPTGATVNDIYMEQFVIAKGRVWSN